MHRLINLLPGDTRSVEITSSGALLIISLLLPFGFGSSFAVGKLHTELYWSMILSIMAITHLAMLNFVEEERLIRSIINWLSGLFWCHHAINGFEHGHFDESDIITITMSISCFYAFILNFLRIRTQWNNSY